MAKDNRPMQYCKLCEAEAFVKSSLGSKVILDCGHIAGKGDAVVTAPPRGSKRGGPTSREVWLRHQERMGRRLPIEEPPTHTDDDAPPTASKQASEKPQSTATFDPQAAAKQIGDLLKRRDK